MFQSGLLLAGALAVAAAQPPSEVEVLLPGFETASYNASVVGVDSEHEATTFALNCIEETPDMCRMPSVTWSFLGGPSTLSYHSDTPGTPTPDDPWGPLLVYLIMRTGPSLSLTACHSVYDFNCTYTKSKNIMTCSETHISEVSYINTTSTEVFTRTLSEMLATITVTAGLEEPPATEAASATVTKARATGSTV